MRNTALVVLAMLLLLASCAPLEVPPTDSTHPPTINGTTTRPEIPRVPLPPEEQPPTTAPPTTTPPIFVNQTRGAPSVEFDVPLGDTIGQHFPLVTSVQFPLLKHPPIREGQTGLVGYEEELRFHFKENTTGRVIFTKNDDDTIGTFLFFQEDKPILEYRARLLAGRFENLQGREIQILGHTYLIAEASNRSVSLFGVDIASNLVFSNGSKLVVNSSSQVDTRVRVTPNEIAYTLYASDEGDDGVLLAPGERLSEKIPRNRLASRILDIKYVGAPLQNTSEIHLDKTRDGYRLLVDTIRGKITIPLLEEDAGQLILGELDSPLRITPCPASLRYCIAPDTDVLLTTPRGASYLITYVDANNASKDLIIREGSNRYVYLFRGEPGQNAVADIVIDGYPFRALIGPKNNVTGEHNISIDQGFVQGRAELVTRAGAVLRIGDINGTRLPLELRIPASLTLAHREERISLNITLANGDGRVLVGGNLTLVEDKNDNLVGTSQYGVGVFIDRDDDPLPANTGREVTLLVPESILYGVVALEG